jgi:hypothetical protein
VGVAVEVRSGVAVDCTVSVDVAVGGTTLDVRVAVASGEAVPIAVGVLVPVGVSVLVEKGVFVGVCVKVFVGVAEGIAEGVFVGVAEGVFVGVEVAGVTVEQDPLSVYNSARG